MLNDVYILSGVRTAIGDFGGSLKNVSPCQLATTVISEAINRSAVAPEEFEQCVMGHVLHTEVRDMYISRVAAIESGMPKSSRAMTLNRLCGSGLQAIVSATQQIQLGDVATAVAGGAESMSRASYLLPAHRWGQRMGDGAVLDMVTGVLTDPFGHGHMGNTAENVGREFDVSRAEQDSFALESHRRASAAIQTGRFESQIVAVDMNARKPGQLFRVDEHVRPDLELDKLSSLRAIFDREGTVTVGNASGINDGAAAVTLASGQEVARIGATPLARIVAYGHSGVAPEMMGMGPVEAVRQALQRAQISLSDIDLIESNEAFASQACAVSKVLGLSADKVNPNGGAVALGHPVGATGAILVVKSLYELARTQGRYGLITMCIGGGQGIALVIERL